MKYFIFWSKSKPQLKIWQKLKMSFLWPRTKLIHFSKLKQEWNILDESDDVIVPFLENLNFYQKIQNKLFFSMIKQNSFSRWCWRHQSIFRKIKNVFFQIKSNIIKTFSTTPTSMKQWWWIWWRHHSIFRFYWKWSFYHFLLNFLETSKNKSDDVINLFLENVIKLTTNQF